MAVDDILSRLHRVRRSRNGWTALCPSHQDRERSLSIAIGDDGRVLLRCFAGCPVEAIVKALGLELKELFPDRRRDGRGEGGLSIPPETLATVQPAAGLTLAQYAAAKRLPPDFLRRLGLSDFSYLDQPAVRIPYLDQAGAEVAVRFRLNLEGENRFRWKTGAKPTLYGLWLLARARTAGYVVLTEGESDAQTLWFHEIPALGIPGATSWRETWVEHLDGILVIYVVIEPDKGGESVHRWLNVSRIRDRVRLVSLGEHKDPSALYVADSENFLARWQAALRAAVPWTEQAQIALREQQREAWARCETLAKEPRILDRFSEALAARGVAGEVRAGKLMYLILITRFLERPVSAVVKGPSSAGKNFLTQCVLDFFPPSAHYTLSAMSERALAYSEESLTHRFLVIFEAVGLGSDFASYLVRSLLSEGRLRYETVERTRDGLRPRLIEREGPTGLLVTTTAVKLPEENETRLFSIPVTDTPEQTTKVLHQKAQEAEGGERPSVDPTPWHALQAWLEGAERRVRIPYATALASLIPPVAVRLRRDFPALLSLITAHAILHQGNRSKDEDGAILASLQDYAVVRELVGDLVAEGVEAAVSATTRETVDAVRDLCPDNEGGVTVKAVARALHLDKASASRRVHKAADEGYLKNLEDRKGRAAKLVLGEPLPEQQEILPRPNDPRLQGCTVAGETDGINTPPSPQRACKESREP